MILSIYCISNDSHKVLILISIIKMFMYIAAFNNLQKKLLIFLLESKICLLIERLKTPLNY